MNQNYNKSVRSSLENTPEIERPNRIGFQNEESDIISKVKFKLEAENKTPSVGNWNQSNTT